VAPITVKLNNLSAMEINTIRPFFQGSLDRFYSLSQVRKLIQWPLHHVAYTLDAHTGDLLSRWRTTFTARSRRTQHSHRARVSLRRSCLGSYEDLRHDARSAHSKYITSCRALRLAMHVADMSALHVRSGRRSVKSVG